jgi:MTH538 TIR-like domain (DUF1863)
MARNAFYSFHYLPDCWRASQVRNMGVVDGNKPASDNDWETVKKEGDTGIEKWINNQLQGSSVVILLIGANTADRKWINYEIKKGWNEKKGVLGIYVHNLKNSAGEQSLKGANPFEEFTIGTSKIRLSTVVKAYDPPYAASTNVYKHIQDNLAEWIEHAIEIRGQY